MHAGPDGHGCPTVTGAGTGTFYFEGASGLYTEVQPGSWFFGDEDYAQNEGGAAGSKPEWEQVRRGRSRGGLEGALYVATTVISASDKRNNVVVDAGSKAVSLDSGPPTVRSAHPTIPSCPSCGLFKTLVYTFKGRGGSMWGT
eukprot:1177088-Prorocentrum_minimum.AAC.2